VTYGLLADLWNWAESRGMAQIRQAELAETSRPTVGATQGQGRERGVRAEWSDGDGLKVSWRIDVKRYYGKGLLGVSGAELPQGRCVWVREPHAVYGAYVRSCLPTGNSYAVDLEFRHVGRRGDDRIPVGDPIVATWEDPAEGAMVSEGMLLNVSDGGLQVSLTSHVVPGALVRISGNDFECLGTASYSIPTEGGRRVGVQFLQEPALRELELVDQLV
jgi:hypothetical protein